MPEARLTLTLPESCWVGEVTRQHPAVQFSLVGTLTDGQSEVCLAEICAPAPESFLETMESHPEVVAVETLSEHDDEMLVQVEAEAPSVLAVSRSAGIPPTLPFVISDGHLDWELTTSRDDLSSLRVELDRSSVTYSVEHIQDCPSGESLLTETQQEVLDCALSNGYYDTPRDCSLTDLASELDIAKSTASEILHRAEERIVKHHADGREA